MNVFAKAWLIVYCFGPLLMIVLDAFLAPSQRTGESSPEEDARAEYRNDLSKERP